MNKKIISEIFFIIVRLAIVAALIYAGYRCTSYCYDFGFRIFADEAKDPAPGITKTVAIVEGKSVKEIGDVLKEKGLIDNSLLFMFQVKFSEFDEKLQPGVYELSTAMSPFDMMAVMAAEDEEAYASDEDEENSVPAKDAASLWDAADDDKSDKTETDIEEIEE